MRLKITSQKEIEINLDSFRRRVSVNGLYTDKERDQLLKTYDLFEQGNFEDAIKVIKDMPDEWEGYVDEAVYDTLVEFQRGAILEIIK